MPFIFIEYFEENVSYLSGEYGSMSVTENKVMGTKITSNTKFKELNHYVTQIMYYLCITTTTATTTIRAHKSRNYFQLHEKCV